MTTNAGSNSKEATVGFNRTVNEQNKDKAMQVLRSRIYDLYQSKQDAAVSSARKSMVGSGDRSERVRTYNFPQNRLTDLRIGYTSYNLDIVIGTGALDDIISHMQHAEMQERMDELQ